MPNRIRAKFGTFNPRCKEKGIELSEESTQIVDASVQTHGEIMMRSNSPDASTYKEKKILISINMCYYEALGLIAHAERRSHTDTARLIVERALEKYMEMVPDVRNYGRLNVYSKQRMKQGCGNIDPNSEENNDEQ